MSGDYINIGEIVNTQGHRGEIRILPLTDFLNRFNQLDAVNVLLNGKRSIYHIENARRHKQFIVLKFTEVQDMNAAEKLKGGILQITREQLVPLPEGEYYIFDIIGLSVYDVQGQFLGKIKDVLRTGANDVYVVKPADGKDILIPALKSVVSDIDVANGRMTVELPEGLLE